MGLIRYIGRLVAEMQRIDREYEAAYRRCFEGTPDEMTRRLEAWDYAHQVTRRFYSL
jgi:hypothetical protein